MRLKSILGEVLKLNSISAEGFADKLAKYWINKWLYVKREYGDRYPETNDVEYIIDQIENGMDGFYIRRGYAGFIYECMKRGTIAHESFGSAETENIACHRGGCYYNALDFILKTDRDNVNLAFGLMVEQKFLEILEKVSKEVPDLDYQIGGYLTEHAFIVTNDGKIIDPTFPNHRDDDYYAYQIVPESDYKKFDHEFDDPNYNARDFANYIERELKKYAGVVEIKNRIRAIASQI